MTLSLHIIVDNAPPERLDRAVAYLRAVKPAYVNIGAGSQLDRGMQFVDRVRAQVPETQIIWRNLAPEDTGIHTKMNAVDLYNLKVRPYLDWFKRNELIFMPDNESSGDDDAMRRYVAWEVEMLILLHKDNLRGAMCRFSTGTIRETQYELLKPIFSAMLPGDVVSPNEYSNAVGRTPTGAGHLERYKLMHKAAGRELPTVIGEAGIAVDYDPGKGYQDIGMPGAKYGQQMLDEEIWYLNGKITRCLYLIGGYTHQGYRLGDDVLEYLQDYYETHPAQPPAPDPIPPPPPPPTPPIPGPVEPPPPTPVSEYETAIRLVAMKHKQIAALQAEIDVILRQYLPAA